MIAWSGAERFVLGRSRGGSRYGGWRALVVALATLVTGPVNAQVQLAPAPVVSATVAASSAATVPDEYRIAAGDELDVSVWGDERMQRTVRVLSDGTFAFPLAGSVPAAGQTVKEVSSFIRQRIAGNYRTEVPDVTVGVRTASSTSFFVVGKVRTPGTYASGRAVNVLQALSMAGGLADFADVKHAVILRQTAGGQVVEPVRLANVLKGRKRLDAGVLSVSLPVLRNGDVLVVP